MPERQLRAWQEAELIDARTAARIRAGTTAPESKAWR